MKKESRPAAKPAAKRGKDTTRSVRAAAHLERLEDAKGKRLVVDLDAPAREALEALIDVGYGATQAQVVRQALVRVAKEKVKKTDDIVYINVMMKSSNRNR